MGTVRVFTAARSKQIEDTTVVSGSVNSAGDLTLLTRAGEPIVAGNVKGVPGDKGETGDAWASIYVNYPDAEFDEFVDPGVYHFTASANGPTAFRPTHPGFTSGSSGFLMVEGNSLTFIKQTWTNQSNPSEILVRTFNNGAWTSWRLPIEASTISQLGVVQLATNTEVQTGSDTNKAVTPGTLHARTSTESRTGLIELATDAEVKAGTDAGRAVTPDKLRTWELAKPGKRLEQVLYFTSSGSYVRPAGQAVQALRVRVIGGGGGGGGAPSAAGGNHSAGGGGGGGGYSEAWISTPLSNFFPVTFPITVGAGGTSAVNAIGTTGGTSSFGDRASATGGEGGNINGNTPLMGAASGGQGGIGTVGDFFGRGTAGGNGSGYSTLGHGGNGGGSIIGGGARGVYTPSGSSGEIGVGGGEYGGGGGGSAANASSPGYRGGYGGAGIVIVEVYS